MAEKKKDKKKKDVKVKKPSFFLYHCIAPILMFFSKIHWHIKINNREIKHLKGPILALSPHASTIDIVPVFGALYPKRFNIVAAKDLFTWKELSPFLDKFGVLPINQTAMDLSAIRTMKNAIEQGRNILIFPEGKTSLDGKQLYYMDPAIAKLIKLLGAQVVLVKTHGAYITKPRYIKGFRKGKMEAEAKLLFKAEDLKNLTADEIFTTLKSEFKYNDILWQQQNNIKFKAKNLTSNLNYILYKCPRCGEEYSMKADKDLLVCEKCNNTVRLTRYGHLVPENDGVSIDRLDLWVEFERDSLRLELGKEDFKLENAVELFRRDDEKRTFGLVGEGNLYIDKNDIGYKGTKDGNEWSVSLPLENMPEIITKNQEGVDLMIDGVTYRFLFKEKKYSAKYGLAVEELFARRHGITIE